MPSPEKKKLLILFSQEKGKEVDDSKWMHLFGLNLFLNCNHWWKYVFASH
jgi:hypothetical protein